MHDHQLSIHCWPRRENCLRRTCRPNFYSVTLYAMHSSYIFFGHAISRHKLPLEQKNSKLRLLCNGTIFNDLGRPTHRYTTFLSRDAMLVRYILCDGPVLWAYYMRIVHFSSPFSIVVATRAKCTNQPPS